MNPLLENLDFERLHEIYVMANTPAYLFGRFREIDSIQNLGEKNTVSEIRRLAEEIGAKPISDLNTLLALYAILIALSFKSFSEIKPLLDDCDFQIEWGDSLKRMILSAANPISETAASLDLRFKLRKEFTTNISNSSETLIKL